MKRNKIISIDQGTTSSRAVLFDQNGTILMSDQYEFTQYFPSSGEVEHDAEEIWQTSLMALKTCLTGSANDVGAIGITNQRETVVMWDRATGQPLHKALVWQDRRTAGLCADLKKAGQEKLVRQKTGLVLDPYFSAGKIAWLLDNVEGARQRADAGDLCIGTIDSFLIYRLTGGKSFVTDATNASRTSLYDITKGQWDDTLLDLFNVPLSVLPRVLDCAADFGTTEASITGYAIPITGVAGDQQAATFGQACFEIGETKATYGTGAFMLLNTGAEQRQVDGLLTTVCYQLGGKPTYALEGSVFIAGAVIQWLRDQMGILEHAADSAELAASIDDTDGVYFVPAFTGLGAPYWDPDARGLITGLSRGTGRAELVRAALESVAYQTVDLLSTMEAGGIAPKRLRVDGGMVANNWFVQFLCDSLGLVVDRPTVLETTALGAAYLAGLGSGMFSNLDDIKNRWALDTRFTAAKDDAWRADKRSAWQLAVSRTRLKA